MQSEGFGSPDSRRIHSSALVRKAGDDTTQNKPPPSEEKRALEMQRVPKPRPLPENQGTEPIIKLSREVLFGGDIPEAEPPPTKLKSNRPPPKITRATATIQPSPHKIRSRTVADLRNQPGSPLPPPKHPPRDIKEPEELTTPSESTPLEIEPEVQTPPPSTEQPRKIIRNAASIRPPVDKERSYTVADSLIAQRKGKTFETLARQDSSLLIPFPAKRKITEGPPPEEKKVKKILVRPKSTAYPSKERKGTFHDIASLSDRPLPTTDPSTNRSSKGKEPVTQFVPHQAQHNNEPRTLNILQSMHRSQHKPPLPPSDPLDYLKPPLKQQIEELFIQAEVGQPLSKTQRKQCNQCIHELAQLQNKHPTATTLMLRLYEVLAMGTKGKTALELRANAAQAVQFKKSHPLYHVTEAINKNSQNHFEICKKPDGNCGLFCVPGSPHVVGNLVFQTRPHQDNHLRDELAFEISLPAKKAVATHVEFIQNNLDAFNKRLPKALGGATVKTKQTYFFQKRVDGNYSSDRQLGMKLPGAYFTEIEFRNKGQLIGTVYLSTTDEDTFNSLHALIRVETPSGLGEGVALTTMQQMLTVLGFDSILGEPLPEDREREKLQLIVDAYFPFCWAQLQQTKDFYSLSIASLKKKIIESLPPEERAKAGEILNHYEKNPRLFGKVKLGLSCEKMTLADFSKELQKTGYIGCMSGVPDSESVMLVCQSGLYSTEMRQRAGITSQGESALEDTRTGGSRGVFLRIVNENVLKETIPVRKWKTDAQGKLILHSVTQEPLFEQIKDLNDRRWQFAGKYQLVISPEVVNQGCYAYYEDQYGKRAASSPSYQHRDNLFKFMPNLGTSVDKFSNSLAAEHDSNGNQIIQVGGQIQLKKDDLKGTSNEVVINGGMVPPRFFIGINCIDNQAKEQLIKTFDSKGLIFDPVKDKEGKIIDGFLLLENGAIKVRLSNFLHVGNKLEKKMWEPKKG